VTNRHVAGEFVTSKVVNSSSRWVPVSRYRRASTSFRKSTTMSGLFPAPQASPCRRTVGTRRRILRNRARIWQCQTCQTDYARIENCADAQNVAAIGYPAFDSRIPEPALMERIFGKTYNKKRLAPGSVTRVEETRIWHNCTRWAAIQAPSSSILTKETQSGFILAGAFSRRTTRCAPMWSKDF